MPMRGMIKCACAAVLASGLLIAPTASAAIGPGDYVVGDSGDARVFYLDSDTGKRKLLSDDDDLVNPNDSAIGANGTIYVSDYGAFGGGGGVFKINPKTGATRTLSDSDLFDQPDGIALGPSGDLFVTDIDAGGGSVFRVDVPSGDTELISDSGLLAGVVGIVVPPNGRPIVNLPGAILVEVLPETNDAEVVLDGDDGWDGEGSLTRGPDGLLYGIAGDGEIQAANLGTKNVVPVGTDAVNDGYAMAFDWFRNSLLSTDNTHVYRHSLANGNHKQLQATIDYAEGLEVIPPNCAGRSATIVGTPGKDVLRGSKFADVIAGLGGDDVLKGAGGRDRICGGGGKDKMNGGTAEDLCAGGPGRDRETSC